MDLHCRTVLVTGANRGIGSAIARRAAAEGAHVVLAGRRPAALAPLATELGADIAIADLSEPGGAERLAADQPEVDVLIANAAVSGVGSLLGMDIAEIDEALTVNLRAPIVLARLLAEAMVVRRSGHIVLIGSLNGKTALPGTSLYAATKFGLRGFARALRADLAPSGVGVSLVSPGFVRDEGMFARGGAKLPPGVGLTTPRRVADGVVTAVRHNRAEVDVAPATVRLGAAIGGTLPGVASRLATLLGAERSAEAMRAGLRRDEEPQA